ncbi:glycerophosphoryl diester phosphodiesterase membrane domain-containing protein [Microbacterium telephonicum]|uniref:DUF7847 domain-containing protein n=1 Tax=Microbacterium telephonicum TaxID=1714841 RepID=A0A498C4M2_9MICO|nr:glycerophosphoryl diester phosphodiesterase membrane domain-containing protein [Microbacterium telephonicum]RLK47728.1 hypothetical protein C7474_2325 [Microbacterium telephonicum]
MTAYPSWTPASRPGIVPLQPLGFGTVLGRSFTALRHNPRVLLGFAMGVQLLAVLIVAGAGLGLGMLTFSRLASLQPGSEDFEAVMTGSTALMIVMGIVLSVASTALTVVVQAVVVLEVTHAVVAEKLTVRQLWRQVRPALWRLIGYSLLLLAVIVVAVVIAAAVFFALSVAIGPAAIVPVLLLVIATIPLWLWLSTKLMLVPAVIVVEGAGIRAAIARSWRLIRGRFWVGLGVTVVVSLVFGTLAQVVSLPLTFAALGISTALSPTGDPEVGAFVTLVIVTLITYALTFVIQSISLVVLATATTLVYVDCRMRHEGLDLDLLAYVERRDAGETGLADPYLLHIGRSLPRWAPPVAASPYAAAAAPAPPSPPVTRAPVPFGAPPPAPAAPVPAPAGVPTPGAPQTTDRGPAAPGQADTPSATQWTAPGAPAERP